MTQARTAIFVTGPTGYIGGSVLARLLKHPNARTFDISAITRSEEKARKLHAFGVNAVVGALDNNTLTENLASNAHVVFDCADADNLDAVRAIIRGLKRRHDATGDVPIYIHTSGTGVLSDYANGIQKSELIYNDLDPDQIESIPLSAPHRQIDIEVVDADKAGFLRSYIILPSTIYAMSTTPLVDAGIQNPHSLQIPTLIKAALDRKQAGVVGKGNAFWPDVHIDDTADLFMSVYDAIVADPDKTAHGREGFFFGENGEHTWYEISRAIGEVLVELGISRDPGPTTFSDEELVKYFGSLDGGNNYGSNSRCRGNHSRSIGWKPKYTKEDMIASIKPEIEAILHAASK